MSIISGFDTIVSGSLRSGWHSRDSVEVEEWVKAADLAIADSELKSGCGQGCRKRRGLGLTVFGCVPRVPGWQHGGEWPRCGRRGG